MDMLIWLGITLALTLMVMSLYILGYRHGWGNGYERAFCAIMADFRKGKELFFESGLNQWELPGHWETKEIHHE
jgi:hypothetical protein